MLRRLPPGLQAAPTGAAHRLRYRGHVLRRIASGAGAVLIGLGVLVLLFVVYQLWGTNLAESSSQGQLSQQFAQQISHRPKATGAAAPAAPEALPGGVIAHLRIPAISVDKYVVEGVGEEDLKKGPGHYAGTPLPGQVGNVAIAGHRTTYGAPFYNLNELKDGDPIYLSTTQGNFEYLVTSSEVVDPSDVGVVANTPDQAKLTLTTCNPRFSAATRLIVFARLTAMPLPAAAPALAAPRTLTHSSADILTTVLYGVGALLVGVAAWLLGSRWRRLPAWLMGTPAFLVVLYFFFENVSRLLPSSI